MTISTQTASITASGDGSNTTFAYDFLIPYQADGVTPAVSVYTTTSSVNTDLTLGVDYSITGVGDAAGGTITCPLVGSALAVGTTITINRALDYVQETALEDQGFRASQVESALDTLEMQIQQLADGTVQGPRGEPGGNILAVGLFSAIGTLTIPSGTSLIQTSGYAAVGVGAGLYAVTASTGATLYRTQSADGRWWTLVESSPTFYHFGAVGDGSTDDSAAIAGHIAWMFTTFNGGVVRSGRGVFKCTTAPTWHDNIKLVGEGKGTVAEGFPSRINYNGTSAFFINPAPTTDIMSECWIKDIAIIAPNVTDTVVDFTSVGSSFVTGSWISGNTGAVCSGIKCDCPQAAVKTITGITKANPAVVTSNSHGKSNGDVVLITGVVGMTQVNNVYFTVAGATANTFQLSGVNSSGYGAYVSGGQIRQLIQGDTTYNGFENNYIANVDYGIMFLKSSNSNYTHHNRIQPKASGSGIYIFDDGFTAFPNNLVLDSDVIETSAASVIGINIIGSADGVDIRSPRLELTGASANGISVTQYGDTSNPKNITRRSPYYSGLAAALRVSDSANLSLGVSDPAYPVIQCRLNGNTGAIVSNTSTNVDSASRVSAGRYNIQFLTLGLASVARYAVSLSYNDGSVLIPDIATFDTSQFEVLFVDRAAGTPTDADEVYIRLTPF